MFALLCYPIHPKYRSLLFLTASQTTLNIRKDIQRDNTGNTKIRSQRAPGLSFSWKRSGWTLTHCCFTFFFPKLYCYMVLWMPTVHFTKTIRLIIRYVPFFFPFYSYVILLTKWTFLLFQSGGYDSLHNNFAYCHLFSSSIKECFLMNCEFRDRIVL